MNIFIDLDGPILNNLPRLYHIYFDLILSLGFKPLAKYDYWRLKRDRVKEEVILNKSGCFEKQIIQFYINRRFKDIEKRECLSLNELTVYCYESLKFLSKQGVLVLLTTRKSKRNLMWELRQKKLLEYFKKILCGFDNTVSPWQVKLDLINKYIGCVNKSDIIIGDTEAEILCGKKLGIYSIGIVNGIRNFEQLSLLKPDRIVRNLTDIAKSWVKIKKEIKN